MGHILVGTVLLVVRIQLVEEETVAAVEGSRPVEGGIVAAVEGSHPVEAGKDPVAEIAVRRVLAEVGGQAVDVEIAQMEGRSLAVGNLHMSENNEC